MAGLYIHVPFCHAKCWYCDFYSMCDISRENRYVTALGREWEIRQKEIVEPWTSVYFGGGTPSILSESSLTTISNWLPSGKDITERTIEVNPEDIDARAIETWQKLLGINRISMGIQSLVDTELNAIGRRHSADGAVAAIRTLREQGIENLSLDLIYGLPGQTLDSWRYSLTRLLSFEPEHLSAYMLSYEPGTRLYAQRKAGRIIETDDETLLEMYSILCDLAGKAGYEHYEISNFAKPGMRARHNSAYWKGTPYLGLGPGAHSFDGTTRRANPSNLTQWCESLEKMEPAYITEVETDTDRINDMIMVSLRTAEGLNLNDIPESFRNSIKKKARRLGPDRVTIDEDSSRIVIPEDAWMVSDDTIATLFI